MGASTMSFASRSALSPTAVVCVMLAASRK
jgi:hypothetical protein